MENDSRDVLRVHLTMEMDAHFYLIRRDIVINISWI